MAKNKVAVEFNPSNKEMVKVLKDCIREASNLKIQIEAANDAIKDIKSRAKDELGIDGKTFGKLLTIYHKNERDKFENETTEVVDLYDSTFSN